ncbi:MAG: glycosyltransferase [Proteobacteria bacterium]|nr:glycosyltransferase [Pseudomonadota bacterium]
MRVLFFNHEQYTDFENEAGNIELRLPMLASGVITEFEDYGYQRIQNEQGFEAMIDGALTAVKRFQPNLVVNSTTWPHKSIPPGYIADIESWGYPVLSVFWDTIPDQAIAARFERPLFLASSYFCECGSFMGYARYRLWNEVLALGKKVIFLSGNNVLPEKFRPNGSPKTIDIGLIGSLYKVRIELLTYLNRALAERGVRVEHFGGHFNVERANAVDGRSAEWLDEAGYLDVLNSTKIILCPAGETGQWGVRGKIFEAMACGAFCLIERTPDTSMTIPAEAAATYSGHEECRAAILHYLDNEDERIRQAAAGYQWFNETYNSPVFWKGFLTGHLAGQRAEQRAGQSEFPSAPFVEHNYGVLRDKFTEALGGRAPTPELMAGMNFEV